MSGTEVIHILIYELGNRYLGKVAMCFVANQSHREDAAESGSDEMRILANQQFQPISEILVWVDSVHTVFPFVSHVRHSGKFVPLTTLKLFSRNSYSATPLPARRASSQRLNEDALSPERRLAIMPSNAAYFSGAKIAAVLQ